ncbi:hypothetical protein [Saccharopolyspora phatthalungensis]|uniref:Cyclase n=1 Tax=Saccharopolyspora phatthalungensis TaxID=664693 RepID=A0A840Q1R2_9PSEU|nr:hypothetical protein [Saccharopolyspora phatthalungensis]MBB5152728.1 hypothetical protein [Saccharopolyspora phatthalungensis]
MPILRVQHSVPSFDTWKQLFDRDPIDRKRSGVRHYWIRRGVADPAMVMVDLEFAEFDEAEEFRHRLHGLWAGPAHPLVQDPQTWIIETVESVEL